MKEVEMYLPLKIFLEKKGYRVHSEVESLDVMARKGDELLVVEMKTAFNLQLVYQLIERLKMTELVYAYIPLEKGGRWPKSYKRMCGLLKRLHCGLMVLDAAAREVVVEFEPAAFKGRTNYARKNLAIREFEGRSLDLNQGGSTREPLFTVYKEKAIRVAMYLLERGPAPVGEIREKLAIDNAVSILYDNHLGWFRRVSRGVYQLTPEFEFFRLKYEKQIKQLWR
ncbi:MAG TPA: DUF2161 family putative PD-(D/E)XK-type phosphodiesterase [Verrucomicrobiae bacterium]|nr:DUF2161 family putative PD-(D/E)XK-type phosphodiesterase [Verrucomicrobiae bacterium]